MLALARPFGALGTAEDRTVDGGAPEATSGAFELTDLAVGEHQVVVTATSAAGLASAPVTINWTVTSPAPVVPSVQQGATFDVAGAGFTAGEDVQVWIHSDPVLLATLGADADGAVASTVTIPADIPAGSHRIELRGVTSAVSVWQDVTGTAAPVVAAPAEPAVVDAAAAAPAAAAAQDGSLAVTGSSGVMLGGLAAVLAAVGSGLVGLTRWRRTFAANIGADDVATV